MPDVAPWTAAGRHRPRVVVLAAVNRPRVRSELPDIVALLKRSAEIVAVDENQAFDFSSQDVDLVVTLGGDGSILSAARQMDLQQRPVVGVNLGRLGFLAALSSNGLDQLWPKICAGEFPIVEHVMLECSVWQNGQATHHQLGLNEAAILGGPPFSMLQIDLYVDRELASTYSCDGLIISTPVGSTAHNLSAGGPILHRSLQAVVICPISPHTLTLRPVVDSSERVFDMVVRQGNATTSAVVDGRPLCTLAEGDTYRIGRAPVSFKMIAIPGKNEYQTLRDKLGWGGNPREKNQ
ncbi:MAG: NAD(+)/NADH kinase [Pirellulaceae bacterium]|nr:NAD(+)/NADH kinase [Pirellulaceae bacterium]